MEVIKIGNCITGAVFTKAEKKALDIEVKKALADMDKKNTKEIDAMVLWVLHEQFGFGPERLKKFHDNFIVEMKALIDRYELPKTDTPWLCTDKLEKYGIDLDDWDKEG